MDGMSNVGGRLDRLEGRRRGDGNRRLIDDLAARHGVDAGSIRAEVARILERASAGGWSLETELADIATASGCPVAVVRAEHRRILAEVGA